MPKLYCDVETCLYHQGEYCNKDRIKVNNCKDSSKHETMCDSYKQKRKDDKNVSLFEIASLGATSAYSSITCNVNKCIHNHNEICKASTIKIDGSKAMNKHETICCDYSPKL